jgi:hypothetical protein
VSIRGLGVPRFDGASVTAGPVNTSVWTAVTTTGGRRREWTVGRADGARVTATDAETTWALTTTGARRNDFAFPRDEGAYCTIGPCWNASFASRTFGAPKPESGFPRLLYASVVAIGCKTGCGLMTTGSPRPERGLPRFE